MFWGILIGIILTALTIVLAMSLGKKQLGWLSYLVALVALVAFCIEGVGMMRAIDVRKHSEENVAILQEAARQFIPGDARTYRLTQTDAVGIKLGLKLLHSRIAQYIEPSELAGHTIIESTDVLRESVMSNANRRIWMEVLYMVITLVVATLVVMVTGGVGGRSRSSDTSTTDYGFSSSSDYNYTDYQ